ncbi:hypothetical protein P153DRAFT_7496 [Dothidotthia symphoricarpi CBS 119687]|uniref:Zn(2)-C6 fungal-type domain-containing protein n=1 Tax=Dothidotthia symphoricarpi CBS 119687 TaxID=1392245 RepID=A0A6A6ASR0_9PLEO|nr:uncharacterized protein P153DRAFT_7496 [Dothidotthia symphoricarpi CBS 119687]KAF2134690.1 hypothetical protein P153DRAFT_7496 [Dothidotthia symphoricarpi CBS 119687]
MTASQVCFTCKGRKKKCDKRMPRCSYCEQKNIACCYNYGLEVNLHPSFHSIKGAFDPTPLVFPLKNLQSDGWEASHGYKKSSTTLNQAIPIGPMLDLVTLDSTRSLEVMQMIRASHQSIDDISTRYFKGFHLWIPFLCPDRFREDLVRFQSLPTAEFALLLLCMCLLTYDPPQNQSSPVGHDTLYLHAKTFFAQIHVLRRPSLHLIQAAIFISSYEYARGRPDSALASIDTCARMAYKIGFDRKSEGLGWSEAWNTWWAIRIFERIFYCETSLTGLPLISSAPNEADLLPYELGDATCEDRSELSYSVAPVKLMGVGCLGRAAQATYLLDRVFQTIKNTATTDKISSLVDIDSELQRLLSATMDRCHGYRGGHCGAVSILIRALFLLHQHILQLDTTSIGSQWREYSEAALDTVVQMVLDIARSHRVYHGANIDIISPACNYVVRHTLQYFYEKRGGDSNAWFQDSDTLRRSLDKLNSRWPMEPGIFSDH